MRIGMDLGGTQIEAMALSDVIVLGGGSSNLPRLYRHAPARWADDAFSDRVDT